MNRPRYIFRFLWTVVLAGFISTSLVGCGPAQIARSPNRRDANGVPLDRKRFAKGACASFSPTSGDNHHTIFIDAGHGGIDPGAQGTTETGQTIYEADETLPVALDLMALLRARGYRVVVSRTHDTNVARLNSADVYEGALSAQGVHDDVAARDICANMAKATILLGIYFDAGASDTDAGSITSYDADRLFATDNLRLATLVQNDVLASMNKKGWQIPNDGVVPDTNLGGPALTTAAEDYGHLMLIGPADPSWFTTPSQMPGTLTEPLYITDPFEGSIAARASGQEAIAKGMAKAVEQYFVVKGTTPKKESPARRA